ncbi:KELT protein [Plasmodium ovale wallikeri]|uniref:KELT protein n=1 Tax=Plasmodium ovale wallikeri TaxID=864142 RepID=A0A1A8ZKI4_PLAOA|nr:KELT protein [Plasmodium ovale wallikeri]SBT44343.1 KELT protein [Plasmodium ovale wallikeri]
MSHLYVLTVVILLCTSKPRKINKCVRRINFAEREPTPQLKGNDTEEEFDEEFFTTHMSLLSMGYTGKEENENIEELGATWGMDELGAAWGMDKLGAAWGVDKLGAAWGMDELGAAWGMDKLGAAWGMDKLEAAWGMDELGVVGGIEALGDFGINEALGDVEGIEEMEEVENIWSSESEDEYIRTSRDSRKKIELKEFEEYAKTYEDFTEETEIETEKYEYQQEQISVIQDYNKPYKRSTYIDKKVLELFVESVNRSNALLPTVSASLIEEYLSAGINGKDRISKLHNEYPLNRCKRIDFKNLRRPFGIEMKSLKNMNEDQLNDAIFFDDFFACSLGNFLKETKVGKFSLAEACMFYKVGSIRFIPCSLELLKYLSSVFPLFDIDDFLYSKMGTYLGRSYGFFFIFADRKIPLIRKNTIKDKHLLEKMKTIKTNRELTLGEKQALRHIFYYANINVSRLNKLIKLYESRISIIEKDLGTLVQFFPVNKKHIHRNDLIIVSMHYILSFCVHLIKPLYDKAQMNMLIGYKNFYYVSSYLNYLINLLEMLEFNSELCNMFSTLYPEFDKYYPRLKYVEEITTIYNYLLVKLQSVVVIYDISKFLLKLYMASDMIKDYRENVFILYTKILSDTEVVLRDAEELIKELT